MPGVKLIRFRVLRGSEAYAPVTCEAEMGSFWRSG